MKNDYSKAAGNALVFRLRLGYPTLKFHCFQIYANYECNRRAGANAYNRLGNGHDNMRQSPIRNKTT